MNTDNGAAEFDAIVVGAGFSGIYMVHRLRELGLTVRAFEAADGVGGTWFWNRYPGARCDCISMEYAYTFSPELIDEWEWTERYPAQPEILRYLDFAADKLDVKKHFRFRTRVVSASFDDHTDRWTITTDTGESAVAKYFVTAVGCLSTSQTPQFPGLENFEGETYHTADWPSEGVDFSGKRVGVIGTGSSGVQVIPLLAEQAEALTVFQRTPAFSLDCGNRALTESEKREFKENIETFKAISKTTGSGQYTDTLEVSALDHSPEERWATYEERWNRHRAIDLIASYPDLFTNREANETIAEFFRSKIRAVVEDPELAEQLSPRTYPLGAKRITLDTNYFQTYNRDNVELVSLREAPLEEFTARGIRTGGVEHELDAVVLATGFDAITGPLLKIGVTGVGGRTLQEKWKDGPVTYLGIAVDEFPNMFMLTGPGSPNVLTNVVCAIEQHVEWTSNCIEELEKRGARRFEALEPHAHDWTELNDRLAQDTLYPEGNSWYTGANVPGKPRVILSYVGGLNTYRDICDEVAAEGYRGFAIK
ncbi:flavin-containing monooxygenase [Rhodococcus chondri]|uniref:NAD(P)/FAD-dependent oxidoreductase n=1 Tax=Rhodococcus chondri TaxID=3065941 RepID=A0ABU7JTU5_9NOCA|nr:NAD(P)/FAD-dependent oxidoreductase [Rhodococcus sp. CC-R104]MEE2033339.1 NAD(P)/FAD-dependent oxidoreductase [Rhodococcus sp. CC-R104]